jgi:acyl-coenzyme A synthetase/AMP-(fatty) acid ligase
VIVTRRCRVATRQHRPAGGPGLYRLQIHGRRAPGQLRANGWNFPGDAFVQDEEGYFVYQARTDDMIITAGYNVAGPEVEAALLQAPGGG